MESIRRHFSLPDQRAFARLSGDFNPIHIDPVFARRLMFGVPIVHGVHLALWALGEQGRTLPPRAITSLKVAFLHPVPVDAAVDCRWSPSTRPCRIELHCDGQVAARLDVDWTHESVGLPSPDPDAPPKETPVEVDAATLAGLTGSIDLHLRGSDLEALLPEVARQLPPAQVASLLATTRLIGNRCPGLNSVYSSLRLSADAGAPGRTLDFRVRSFDPRFGALCLQLQGPGWIGAADVFLRPPPARQANYASASSVVAPGEFEGARALVVGGSRGLGEVAAKLLCAGGAEVTLTYFAGRDDAEALVREIATGGGRAQAMHLDATAPLPTELPEVDLLVFTSTPFIFSAVKGRFDGELFDRFCAHYVHGFSRLCVRLAARRPLMVLCPSSSAVDEVPANMGEYAAAKAASEVACRYLEGAHKGLRIHRPRLPRLATDQTGSIVPVYNADPVPVMLQGLRTALGS
jgi:acyl dehydratase